MIFDTPKDEADFANNLIAEKIAVQEEEIAGHLLAAKEGKKAVRKLKKQLACQHEFTLKQTTDADHYKCKGTGKCKFEFVTEADKAPLKNRHVEVKFDELYQISDDDAPQVARE